jgi:hypothetical protein
MVFNATLNNISVISIFELTTSVVIGTDCMGSCKFNYHTLTATTALGHERLFNITLRHKLE